MAMSTFRSGDPEMVDYTPGSGNVAVGDVVVISAATTNSTTGAAGLLGIAHRPIVNNTLGTLAIAGGTYSFVNLNNAALGAIVYWDASTNKATTVTNSNCLLGKIVANGGGGANTTCYVYHMQTTV